MEYTATQQEAQTAVLIQTLSGFVSNTFQAYENILKQRNDQIKNLQKQIEELKAKLPEEKKEE